MVQSAWIPGNHSIAHYRIESKFRVKYGVVTQSESATEIEMVLPDTSLPQISQSEPFTTNVECVRKFGETNSQVFNITDLTKTISTETESVRIDCHTSFS